MLAQPLVHRIYGIALKQWRQLLRDRVTAALVFGVPIAQLLLFGFAIDLEVRHWPAAWVSAEGSFIEQTTKARIQQSGWLDVIADTDHNTAQSMLVAGTVRFVVSWPAHAEAHLANGNPVRVIAAYDASDPWVTQAALGAIRVLNQSAVAQSAADASAHVGPFTIELEPRFGRHANAGPQSARWVLPGLIGVVLTLSLTLLGALCVVREVERGTWDGLRMSAARPLEIMVGKLLPYVVIGMLMLGALLLLCRMAFALPISSVPLIVATIAFIAANLMLGLVISLIAKSQFQAMQLGVFVYLPSILLSGFLFPPHVMPAWARGIGEALPLTHYLPIVRAAMVREAPGGIVVNLLAQHLPAICGFTLILAIVAWGLLARR